MPRLTPSTRIHHDGMGKLPSIVFGRYTLHDDFITFVSEFVTVADTYRTLDQYYISRFRACFQGEARDLFKSRARMLNCWSLGYAYKN